MNWLDDNVNQLGLLGAAVILILSIGIPWKYIKQMKTDKSMIAAAPSNDNAFTLSFSQFIYRSSLFFCII